MYNEQFCKVYNEFGWNYFPEAFAEQLFSWMREERLSFTRALDLGCGTGVLCERLNAHGIPAEGADLSEGMVAVARARNADIVYTVADMTVFVPETRPDLVTCTGDALNHLLSVEDVRRMFRTVKSYIAPGGYFVFDILSGEELGDGAPIELEYSPTVHAVFRIVPEDGLVRLRISVTEDGKGTFTETVTETLYETDTIRALLKECGFTDIRVTRNLVSDSLETGTTVYFIAKG